MLMSVTSNRTAMQQAPTSGDETVMNYEENDQADVGVKITRIEEDEYTSGQEVPSKIFRRDSIIKPDLSG